MTVSKDGASAALERIFLPSDSEEGRKADLCTSVGVSHGSRRRR
jgi:hypothetical protein